MGLSDNFIVAVRQRQQYFLSLLANSRVERCHADDLMLNVPIACLPPSRVDPKVQWLNLRSSAK